MTDLDPRALESELDEKLPCDVQLPGVKFNRGCKLSTLLAAIRRREDWPDEDARLSQPQAGEPVAEPYAYEFGRSNGDDTYSVFIERSLPPKPHPDWPVKPLYAPQPALAVKGEVDEPAERAVAWRSKPKGTIYWTYGELPPDGPSVHLFDVEPLFVSPPPSGEVAERMRAILTNGLKPSFVGGQLQIAIDDDVFSALAAISVAPATADGWRPTHRHVKRGSEYVLLGFGKMQANSWFDAPLTLTGNASVDMREVAIYRSVDDGSLWARPREEFEDGRFEVLPAAPTATGGR